MKALAFFAWCAWVLVSAWFLDGYREDDWVTCLGVAIIVIDVMTLGVLSDYWSNGDA